MGKPTICIGENKDADQLRGNREADQRLCFRYSVSYQSLPGPICSKLTMLLVDDSLKFQMAILQIHCHFC